MGLAGQVSRQLPRSPIIRNQPQKGTKSHKNSFSCLFVPFRGHSFRERHAKSSSTKQPARPWPLRGRKQLDAFERNLSPSQKHGLFTEATPGCYEMTQAEERNRHDRQDRQEIKTARKRRAERRRRQIRSEINCRAVYALDSQSREPWRSWRPWRFSLRPGANNLSPSAETCHLRKNTRIFHHSNESVRRWRRFAQMKER